MFAESRHFLALVLLALSIFTSPTFAAKPAKELLSPKTKVYVSVPDLDELQTQWGKTQLGQLFQEPLMQPFMKDFAKELDATNAGINQRLRISLSDLKSIAGGEVCFAISETDEVPKNYAYILAVDTTGKEEQRRAVLKKINQDLVAKKAKWKVKHVQGVPLVSYDIPPQKAGDKRRELHLFSQNTQLVFSDQESAAAVIIDRLANSSGDSLAKDKSFITATER